MKRKAASFLAMAAMLLLTTIGPITAQEATQAPQDTGTNTLVILPDAGPEESPEVIVVEQPSQINWTVIIVAVIVLAGFAIWAWGQRTGRTPAQVIQSQPPWVTDWLLPTVLNFLMTKALETPDTTDEDQLIAGAGKLGYQGVKMPDGRLVFTLQPKPPEPTVGGEAGVYNPPQQPPLQG